MQTESMSHMALSAVDDLDHRWLELPAFSCVCRQRRKFLSPVFKDLLNILVENNIYLEMSISKTLPI